MVAGLYLLQAFERVFNFRCQFSGDCYLRRKYESLVGRRGKKRALIAVGHKILIAAYHIIKDKVGYKDLGYDYVDARRKTNQVQSYLDKLRNLGVSVEITAIQ